MHRNRMSEQERQWRSRLCQWIHSNELMHGSLAWRERVCGKRACRCRQGEKHVSLFVVRRQEGKVEQLYVTRQMEAMVEQWAKQYQQIKELLEKVSDIYWKRVKRKEGVTF